MDRDIQLDDLADLVDNRVDNGRVIVVSGDQGLLKRLPTHLVEVCSDLSGVGSTALGSPVDRGTTPADAVRTAVAGLTRMTDLATIAHQVRLEVGAEATADWGGHGTFKGLLGRVL